MLKVTERRNQLFTEKVKYPVSTLTFNKIYHHSFHRGIRLERNNTLEFLHQQQAKDFSINWTGSFPEKQWFCSL